MDSELLKVSAPYFTSILGAMVAIGIAIFNNSGKTKDIRNKFSELNNDLLGLTGETKDIQNKLSELDNDLLGLKKNHFFHLGEYLKKLNAFLRRGNLMDDVEKADMDFLADGVAGIK